jgi:hypothetical protein
MNSMRKTALALVVLVLLSACGLTATQRQGAARCARTPADLGDFTAPAAFCPARADNSDDYTDIKRVYLRPFESSRALMCHHEAEE